MPTKIRLDAQHLEAHPHLSDRAYAPIAPLRPRIEIPMRSVEPEADAIANHLDNGRFLARQEAWEALATGMDAAESDGARTPGLTPVAALLAKGARADVTEASRASIARGDRTDVRVTLSAFETIIEDAPDSPALLAVSAMAHVDTALAWRGASSVAEISPDRRAAYAHHMAAAQSLATRFDPVTCASPLVAALRCAMLEGCATPATSVETFYDDLFGLDPLSPDNLRALGRDMRPSRFGTWEALESAARRAALQTEDVWGVAGYTWVYIGALEVDPGALRRIDAEFFVEGLHGILNRMPTQDMANRLAAFTGLTMGGTADRDSPRRRIADAFGWIVHDHLRELHPTLWANAPTPGRATPFAESDEDRIRRGRMRAYTSLAAYYAPALETGRRLVFCDKGLRLVKDG